MLVRFHRAVNSLLDLRLVTVNLPKFQIIFEIVALDRLPVLVQKFKIQLNP